MKKLNYIPSRLLIILLSTIFPSIAISQWRVTIPSGVKQMTVTLSQPEKPLKIELTDVYTDSYFVSDIVIEEFAGYETKTGRAVVYVSGTMDIAVAGSSGTRMNIAKLKRKYQYLFFANQFWFPKDTTNSYIIVTSDKIIGVYVEINKKDVLVDLAKNATHSHIRKAAVENLADPVILADIAKTNSDENVREVAIKRLVDLRKAAVEKLADQARLTYIAKTDSDENVREIAIKRLVDLRKAAIEKLTDQTRLAYIAKTDSVEEVREAAVMKLTNSAILVKVAKNDASTSVSITAFKILSDKAFRNKTVLNKTVLADIAKNAVNPRVREDAVRMLTNPAVLADIAKTDSDKYVREAAAARFEWLKK